MEILKFIIYLIFGIVVAYGLPIMGATLITDKNSTKRGLGMIVIMIFFLILVAIMGQNESPAKKPCANQDMACTEIE